VQTAYKYIIKFTISVQTNIYRRMSSSFSGICPCLLWLLMSPWKGEQCLSCRCWNKHCKLILLHGIWI